MEKPPRIVRCPKCLALLQEPTCGISLYKCGNCSTTLRVKNAQVKDVHEGRNTPIQKDSEHGSAPADYVTKHATPEDGHDRVKGALRFVDSNRPPNLKIENDLKFSTSDSSGNASQTSERASGENSEDDLSTFSPTKALAARRNAGPLYKKRESPKSLQTGRTTSHMAKGTLYRGRSPPQIAVELDTLGRQVSDLVIKDENVELSHDLLDPGPSVSRPWQQKQAHTRRPHSEEGIEIDERDYEDDPHSGQSPNRKLISKRRSASEVIEGKARFSEEDPTSCRQSHGNNLTTRRNADEVIRGKDRPPEEDLTSFRSEPRSRQPCSQEALVGSERSEDDPFTGHPVQDLQTPSRRPRLEDVIGIHKRLESPGDELFFDVAGEAKRATSRQPRSEMVVGSGEENSSCNSWRQPKGTSPMRQDTQEVIVNKYTSFEEKQEFAAKPQDQSASMFIKPVHISTRQLAPPANLPLSPPGSLPLQSKLKSMNGHHAQPEFLEPFSKTGAGLHHSIDRPSYPPDMYGRRDPLVDESSDDSADVDHIDTFHGSVQERCCRPQSEELGIPVGNQKSRERTLDENSLQVKSDSLSSGQLFKVEEYEERTLDQGSLGSKSNVQSSEQRLQGEEYEEHVAQKTWDEADTGCLVASGFSDVPQSVPPHQSPLRSPESIDNNVFQACKPGQVDSPESSRSFVVGRACQKQESGISSGEDQSTSSVRLRINTALPERILVVCKHCRVRLEVPPNLPFSKAGHHKLRCGACWKISRFRLDHLLSSSGTSSPVRSENLSRASSFRSSQSPGIPSGRGRCPGTQSMQDTGHHDRVVVRTNSGATVPLPHSTSRPQRGTSGSKLSNVSTAATPSSVPSQTSTPSTSGNLGPPEELLQGRGTSDDLSPLGDDEPSHASHSPTLSNASQDIYSTLADRQCKPSQERKILQSSSDSEEEKALASVNREPAGPLPSPMNAWATADPPEFDDGHELKGIKGFLKKSVKVVTKSKKASQFRRKVVVNSLAVPDDLVRRAEEHAGPIHPGSYWYDMRAGFWGVMGGQCLGMIPPFIDELNYQMVRNCSNGKTGVSVNGRELQHKDLEVLKKRGLPGSPGKQYNLDIDGRLIDAVTGLELKGLGRLAPTLEHTGRGPGMWVPESSRGS